MSIRVISLAISLWLVVSAAQADILSNLTAHFRLHEGTGTSTVDAVGGLSGTLTNTPTWTQGKLGYGLTFAAASTEYVSVSDNAALDFTGDLTVALWVNSTQAQAIDLWPMLLHKGTGTNEGAGWQWALHDTNANVGWFFCVYTAGCDDPVYFSLTGDIADGQWHHLAVTRSGTTVTPYQDGVAGTPVTRTGSSLANTGPLTMGAPQSLDTCCLFSGTLDEIRLYSRALSGADITELYNAGRKRKGLVTQ